MEFLKQFLGDELYNQVEEKLKDNKDIKLVNLASGEYVSKKKYDDLEVENTKLSGQLSERDKDLKTLQENNQDETTKKALEDLTTKYEEDTKQLKSDLANTRLSNALKLELHDKVHDTSIVSGLIDMTKLTYDAEKDKITMGLQEQIEALREGKAFLFKENDQVKGQTPPPAGNNNSSHQSNDNETLESALADAISTSLNAK